ncbi:NAD(P)-binding protein [Annulohypoxylon maeteangense]|uniref:NAD(P)-binding protein n=1 Tax=Annulohypoxylon maeteangense TaxID=1927788 RepID=UPI002008E9CA|nr:NAD(P)-binding protein [Annulohypoxylon maeteangense]KAI0888388.1 NAD(P)-binding protein [Annulohypoxylon maeteangense]
MVLAPHSNPEAPVLAHFSLAGKTAIVTGGCRGIGLEVARGLCEAGAKVAITYSSTSPSEADDIAAQISSANDGRQVKAYKCNVRSIADVDAVVEKVVQELGDGRLDIMVANAGVSKHTPAIDYPEDQFREMFDINVNGAFWAAKAAARVFERQAKADGAPFRGSIIFTASVSATLVNIPQKQAAYNSSKAALVHLSKSLAVEWVDFARVNSISPGFIETEMLDIHPQEWRKVWNEMIPGHRFCKPAELKGIYVFLASDASSYMTGADLIIDGGYTLP